VISTDAEGVYQIQTRISVCLDDIGRHIPVHPAEIVPPCRKLAGRRSREHLLEGPRIVMGFRDCRRHRGRCFWTAYGISNNARGRRWANPLPRQFVFAFRPLDGLVSRLRRKPILHAVDQYSFYYPRCRVWWARTGPDAKRLCW